MKKLLFLFVLSFCFSRVSATTITITGVNQVFSPDSVTVSFGDTVMFQIDSADNAQEVSYNTWVANDSTPVSGFHTPRGGGIVTGLTPGAHYFVSDSDAYRGMKGFIYVLPPATVQFSIVHETVLETTDSVMVIISVNNPSGKAVGYTVSVNPDTNITTALFYIDYTFNTVTFTDTGAMSLDTVYIALIDNPFIQPTKTVVLILESVSPNALVGADSTYTLNILNNDTLTFSFLGAAFSYPQADTIITIGITKSSPVPFNDSVTVVLDSGNAVKGVNFYCPDTFKVYFPADISLTDSTDTVYFPVQLFYDSAHVGNTQVNFRLLPPPGNTQLGTSAFTLFIIGNGLNGLRPELQSVNDIRLFPNPFIDLLSMVTDVALQKVSISDMLGNEIFNLGMFSPGKNEIRLTNLAPGIYFLRFDSKQGSFSEKIIKTE